MKARQIAVLVSGVALLGTVATLLRAQPAGPGGQNNRPIGRAKLRAEVIKLRIEVEMLRFEYEQLRGAANDELKLVRGLNMAGSMMAIGAALNGAGPNPRAGAAPGQKSDADRKIEAEAAKAAEQAEKQQAAQEAEFIAEAKKQLAQKYAPLAAKQMDLEDAEREYVRTTQ
jgi:hypothetical protein